LQLCLTLELPLVIVITKYDLATKAGLKQTVSKLFTAVKAVKEVERKPLLITDTSTGVLEADLHTIEAASLEEADKKVRLLTDSPLAVVPVILTSALRGTGIHNLHALLRKLPIPSPTVPSSPASPSPLFYIEDVYSIRNTTSTDRSAIIGGYLRHGNLSIGDELLLGPHPVDISSDDSDSSGSVRPTRKPSIPQSRSFPGALNTKSKSHTLRDRHSEWRRVRITSLRNLRLPVRTLHAGQVGTMGIVPVDTSIVSPSNNRIRKGMVLSVREPKAYKVITVRFEKEQGQCARDLGVGSAVVVYVASVRASSKVVNVAVECTKPINTHGDDDDNAFSFGGLDEELEEQGKEDALPAVTVTFQFIASREFVELGAKVLVMPGGGPGLSGGNERGAKGMAGLEGFVGRVVEDV
jgi:GTPase